MTDVWAPSVGVNIDTASKLPVVDAIDQFTGTEVESVLAELGVDLTALDVDLIALGVDLTAAEALIDTKMQMGVATVQNTTSGTVFTFSAIPNWAKRITVMIEGIGISLPSTDIWLKLGSISGIESTGYEAISSTIAPAVISSDFATTTHWVIYNEASEFSRVVGSSRIVNLTGDKWILDSNMADIDDTPSLISAGSKTLSTGALTQIQLGVNNGAFVAGQVNIMYEG